MEKFCESCLCYRGRQIMAEEERENSPAPPYPKVAVWNEEKKTNEVWQFDHTTGEWRRDSEEDGE